MSDWYVQTLRLQKLKCGGGMLYTSLCNTPFDMLQVVAVVLCFQYLNGKHAKEAHT